MSLFLSNAPLKVLFSSPRLRQHLTCAVACTVIGALLLASPPASAQYSPSLPTLGDGSEMGLAAERRLGDRIAREIYHDPDYVDDPLLTDYVQSIWQPLQAAARARGDLTPEMQERFAWGLLLIRDRTINAFALPGGYMGVHLGLIGLVANRDELASVLGHELSHVTQRHISRLTTQQGKTTPLIIAAMILGALAASKSPNAASAVFAGSQALAVQSQLNFSRDMEREADRIGYNVMKQAGFEPEAFVTMFEKLQQSSRLNDNGAYPYLRSHPLTSQRIADMQLRVSADEAAQQQHVPPSLQGRAGTGLSNTTAADPLADADPGYSTSIHGMLAARARILADPGVDGLRTWLTEAEASQPSALKHQQARRAAVLYGAVLASMKLRDAGATRRWLAELQNLVQFDSEAARLARLLAIEVALQAGDATQAASLLSPSATDRPELLLRAQVAVLLRRQSLASQGSLDSQGKAASARITGGPSEQLKEALQRLQTWVYGHPHDALAWQWLANVAAAQNLTLRAIRAEAEVQAAGMDLPAAVDRLKAAQDYGRKNDLGAQPGDHIEASIIDTRLREAEAQLREMSREKAL